MFPLPPAQSVYRAMGRASAWERIGVGVMDKSGIHRDQVDYRAQTWSLIYVLRGNGTYRDHLGRTYPLQAGDCFQRRPGQLHSTYLDPDSAWREAWIDLGPALFHALDAMQALRAEPLVWTWGLSPGRVARFTALMRELDIAGEAELPDLCVRCQALAVEALSAARRDGDDPLERLCRILADEARSRIDLRLICTRERLDYEWVRKSFRTRYGVSPNQYRIRRRLERACALLHTTNRPIAAIAAELGYASAYEFSNQFRQWLGVAPTRYRARP